uniref:Uncharacterized protein isoform X2 n=1 Tax=Nicotiana tabacum TaxID=4097 RepID=A0A1S3Z856_TOBAC|nr:dormancy-associated protein homolog 3-like isoform X2 [Nicotiana tomentosiformis]XP_016460583.1 PREDICTED: uncharacterized protein LOC107784032 isoform X2 [Nicotiana tabacum]
MSILDKLWDDTVAGPRPDTGLGKLRKSSTFNLGSSSGKESEGSQEMARVTKRIMIVKPPGNLSKDSPPVSPASASAGSTPPVGEERRHFDSAGDQGHLHTRMLVGLDPEALLLLTTYEI